MWPSQGLTSSHVLGPCALLEVECGRRTETLRGQGCVIQRVLDRTAWASPGEPVKAADS